MAVATHAGHPVPASDITEKRRTALINDLNGHLAHLTDLALAAKQAHWNVRGPNFQGLHTMFDAIVADTRQYADDVAERAVTIGGMAQGTIQAATEGTTLQPFPTNVTDWRELTSGLLDRTVAVADGLRGSLKGMDDEMVTQDLYIEIAAGLEKWSWMLRAHVEAQ